MMTNRVPRATALAALLFGGVSMLTACGAAKNAVDDAKSPTSTITSSASVAPSSSASKSADKPIGGGGIDLGAKGPKNYPADQRSRPGATDCYSGGSRIYDRAGVTCASAQQVLAQYEATPASAKGDEAKVGAYTCSHNPEIMVIQGAPPGKCTDADGNVVMGWRYPGAPQPARS